MSRSSPTGPDGPFDADGGPVPDTTDAAWRNGAGRRSPLLRRRVRMSDVRGGGHGRPRAPTDAIAAIRFAALDGAGYGDLLPMAAGRERLADRLAHLARLRRLEEERAQEAARAAAAPKYAVSEAVPLDQLGFMALMLQSPFPPLAAPAPAASASASATPLILLPTPDPVTQAAAAVQAVVTAAESSTAPESPPPVQVEGWQEMIGERQPPPDIAALMAEYHAQPHEPPVRHHEEPLAAIEPLPVAAEAPHEPVTVAEPPQPAPALVPQAEALSTLDPARRQLGTWQTVEPAVPQQMPAVALAAPAQRGVVALVSRPVDALASAGAVHSTWPSFATGFAIAMAFGVGLYIYLAGA